ncbi:hypothetical protein [Pollutibacter soli]|uniref:hypothetical protein n=1 Tax=Pollutibacter soli TaxID=3034157 RepID=UPI0030133276
MRGILLVAFLILVLDIHAQDTLRGKIYDFNSDSILTSCRIQNLSRNLVSHQDRSGNYVIRAVEGDRILFYMAGFRADTIVVQAHMFQTGYDISLVPESVLLPGVSIDAQNIYRADSLAQREYYAQEFKKQTPLTGYNRPTDGVGVSISPFSYFSKEARDQRRLHKKLIRDERNDYVDHVFAKDYVGRLTGLRGDTLDLFMRKYRPSYEFCVGKSREEMLMYTNDSLKKFRKEMKLD